MAILLAGIVLWAGIHLAIGIAPTLRATLVGRVGENAYKGVFSLLIVLSLVLIVVGWRATPPQPVYQPPPWGRAVTAGLILVALPLFFAAPFATNLKRLLRHPQLGGLALWAGAHLVSNGDQRSLTLFGGLALWALAEMFFINRRDGVPEKPNPLPIAKDLPPVIIGFAAYGALLWLHPYLAGVPAIAR